LLIDSKAISTDGYRLAVSLGKKDGLAEQTNIDQ